MVFDPFGDYETLGYLRNAVGEKDLQKVKRLEHRSFLTQLPRASENLKSLEDITYQQLLDTHKQFFGPIYPWAGQDRSLTSPNRVIKKGPVEFCATSELRLASNYALQLGREPETMRTRPGYVMGQFAFAHPFLEGNGRTILVIHTELARRAGFQIDWFKTNKADYLLALTEELETPGQKLDAYLKPFLVDLEPERSPVDSLGGLPGLNR
ncbi:hypothetical protein ABS71_20275 [bacterium SCN 62-11]|nr:MAG: hypothetical protein ABS71_20275 [bacterium SCN 62-11]